ncbi:MAG: hypothetical protein H7125_14250 [Proteobacteria bacterium]|nr:hypothetical protein [Burkholderiales bacterium]
MKKTLADLLGKPAAQAGTAARRVANSVGRTVADTVGGLATRSADVINQRLPDGKTVRRSVGDALVFGGKLLYDPRATVGELAIGLGQGMRPTAIEDTWLLLRAADDAFVVIGRGTEEQMRLAFERERGTQPVLLCQARAARDAG